MSSKRRDKDIMKLLISDYEVTVLDEKNNNDFQVKMHGPNNSPYEGVNQIRIY
jgi:ubiquitin-protein ligase